jgi:ribosomal protein S27E
MTGGKRRRQGSLPVRKRAAITGTSFDIASIWIRCPQCQKEGPHPLPDLDVNTDVICAYCGHVIDISTPDWRTKINEMAKVHKEIKWL